MVANVNGNLVGQQMRYTAFGEQRLATGEAGTDYRYTGQLSKMDTIGLLFYKARWMDPVTAHFAQADTLVPDPNNVLDWDRYSYVRSNPIRFTDPTGNRACNSKSECEEMGTTPMGTTPVVLNPFTLTSGEWNIINNLPGRLGYYANIGLQFGNQLFKHKGWWTRYLTRGREQGLKFLLRLAYTLEGYSGYVNPYMWNKKNDEGFTYEECYIDALINKPGDFYNANGGDVGILIYIGSRHLVGIRIYNDDAVQWNIGSLAYTSAWNEPAIMNFWINNGKYFGKAWILITNYAGSDWYGSGAYDYGQVPPMPDPTTDDIIWQDGVQVITRPKRR